MGKRVKSRNSRRLSLAKSPTAGGTKKAATKMNPEKPGGGPAAAAEIDVEEMLESSVIFTNDGSSRTRSGLRNGESVQKTPTRSRVPGIGQKELEVSVVGNGSIDTKSHPILTRSLRVRIKEINPEMHVRKTKTTEPLVESNLINDQMTLVLNKIDEPATESPVSSDKPDTPEEDSAVNSELEPVSSVEQISVSELVDSSPSTKSTTAEIEDGLKSPQRSKYLLKQLESSLSPKYMNPNKMSTGVPKSRYGRIQKQKENSDYIPLDVAKFITKSPAKTKAIKTKLEIEPLLEHTELPQEETMVMSTAIETTEPPPESTDPPPIQVDSIQPPEEIIQPSLEPQPEPEELCVTTEPSPPIELSDPSSCVEMLQEEPVLSSESDANTSLIPMMDPNASLIGIDEIQIIDMDASFGESIISATSSAPVAEEVIELPKNPEEPSSAAVVERPPSVLEDNTDPVEYQSGQLLWAAFNAKTPHWPCMLSPDPESGQITKPFLSKLSHTKHMLHVKFFADNGRRAWIKENQVLPYGTVDQYKAIVDKQFPSLRHKLVKLEQRGIWLEAVRQANDTLSHQIEDREKRYQELLDEDHAKAKSTVRRRTKSVSLGYHSNSFEESYESGRKRQRSRTPESPAYEALPLSSNSTESLSKRIKLETNEQDLFRNTISRYFQSMAEGSDVVDTASGTSSECEDITEMLEFDKEIYNNFLNMSRLYVFEGQTETEVDKKLQKYVQKICALRMHSIANGARLSSRLRTQALRKLGRELGIDREKKESSPGSAATTPVAEVKPKKKQMSLEDRFIFELDKNYLLKGVPRGLVCAVCTKPHDLVKCTKCYNHYHLACLTDVPIKPDPAGENKTFTCTDCVMLKAPTCFVCNDQDDAVKEEEKFRCVMNGCGKQYHLNCLRLFPQHKFTGTSSKSSTLYCPTHTCHTCVSDDPRSNATTTKGHLIRCIKCPSSYHTEARCIPAGSQIITNGAMICPKHDLEQCSINVNWCFLCCKGGSLICCETCPTAFHLECLKFNPPEGRYICEECESGRMPLYNEIVWARYGLFRFWPAITVPPPKVPENIEQKPHNPWDICIRFFGTNDYVWINRRRIYLYQEGDSDTNVDKKTTLAKRYGLALEEAKTVHGMLLAKKATELQPDGDDGGFKPPMFVKIKSNRYVPPLKAPKDEMDGNVCVCKATDSDPCGPDSNCINRALMVECNPKSCPAGELCQNQCFEKRQYPSLAARRIPQKGWGLVAQEDIRQGQFVIEYVGEVISNEELERRLQHKVAQKDENYYFLTVDSELTIDAGPKGNLARFINHSCEPNCETMLWTVGGAQSVGLFAIKDIKAGEELTFNYNFESKSDEKKVCHCNASKCSGFIGQKYRPPLESASGSASTGKRRKSDKKGKASKRRKSAVADKRRKSTVDKTTKDETPNGSKRKKRTSMPVDVTIKAEPMESTEEATQSSNGTDDMPNANSDTPSQGGETAIKEEQQSTPESAE